MRTADPADHPDPWPGSAGYARKRLLSMLVLICLAVLCAGSAVAMWGSDDQAANIAAKYVAVFGLTTLTVVVLGAVPSFPVIGRARAAGLGSVDGGPATVIAGSRWYFVLYHLIWLGFAGIFLGAAIETAAAWRTHWPLALVFAVLGSGSAAAPALALIGASRPGRLLLTEEEIVHDAWSSRTRMPWTDIARVTPAFDRRGLILISGRTGARWSHRARTPTVRLGGGARRIWRSDNPAIGGSIALEGDRFAVDEHRLYRFLAFYAGNPSARTELGSPQALDRWNSVL